MSILDIRVLGDPVLRKPTRPVTEVTDDEVTVDGNHPLAGKALKFSGTVTGVRPATQEELAHGHVHGDGGHHH